MTDPHADLARRRAAQRAEEYRTPTLADALAKAEEFLAESGPEGDWGQVDADGDPSFTRGHLRALLAAATRCSPTAGDLCVNDIERRIEFTEGVVTVRGMLVSINPGTWWAPGTVTDVWLTVRDGDSWRWHGRVGLDVPIQFLETDGEATEGRPEGKETQT